MQVGVGLTMLLDRILTSYARRQTQRQLHFASDSALTGLPAPRADHRYLLYLHIPFCEVLCPFCSFHRVEFETNRARSYFKTLRSEIRNAGNVGYQFSGLYFGGGTPTVLVDELACTVELLQSLHSVNSVSVETTPAHLDNARLDVLKSAGINRLSVGVQSFDDQILRETRRLDKYGDGRSIRERLAAIAGEFDTLNVDMIFNFPRQTRDMLQRDLDIVTSDIGFDQVSFYPLMTSRSTRRFIEHNMGGVDCTRERALYKQIAGHMQAAGYQRSSAWCFSRGTAMIDEYIVAEDEYLGLGSGAFSFLDGTLYSTTFSLNQYTNLVAATGTGLVRRRRMSEQEHMRYYLLMRLFSGSLNLDLADNYFDQRFRQIMQKELLALRLLGAINAENKTIRLTESGYYLWVLLMREFFIGVNNFREEMRRHISMERRSLLASH